MTSFTVFVVSSAVAVYLGIVVGLTAKNFDLSVIDKHWIDLPGIILVRLIQSITTPLIIARIVTTICSPSAGLSKHMALPAGVYIVFTTLLSISSGLLLILLIKPGVLLSDDKIEADGNTVYSLTHDLFDLLRNMVPANLIQASIEQYKTVVMEIKIVSQEPGSMPKITIERNVLGQYVRGVNPLGLIVIACVFGVNLKRIGQKGETLVGLICFTDKLNKKLTTLITWYLPIGVTSMIAGLIVKHDDWNSLYKLLLFVCCILLGLIIHGLILLPTIYVAVVRTNPWSLIKETYCALKRAFLTSSSFDTLQLSTTCCERNHSNPRVTGFVLPILSALNKNGFVFYKVATAIFIAQLSGISLSIGQIFTIGVMAVFISTGPANFPIIGSASTFFILTTIQVPVQEASMLVVVEWLLELFNSFVNVFGVCVGVAVVEHLSTKELETQDEEQETGSLPEEADGAEAVQV